MLWINKINTYYIYSKNNKWLHWYVSVTQLAERAGLSSGLKVCDGVGEKSVLENSTCSLQQATMPRFHRVSSLQAASATAQGRAALGASGCRCPHSSKWEQFESLVANCKRGKISNFLVCCLKSIRSKEANLAVVLTLVNWQLSWNYPAVENSLCCFSETRT